MKLRMPVIIALGVVCATICPARGQQLTKIRLDPFKRIVTPRYVVDLKIRQQYPIPNAEPAPVLGMRWCRQINTCVEGNQTFSTESMRSNKAADEPSDDGSQFDAKITIEPLIHGRVRLVLQQDCRQFVRVSSEIALIRNESINVKKEVQTAVATTFSWNDPHSEDVYTVVVKIDGYDRSTLDK